MNDLSSEEQHKLEKIDQIIDSSLFNEDSFQVLQKLVQDNNPEIRYSAVGALINFPSLESEKLLARMLYDSDELVRVNACDSLQFSSNLEIIELLKLKTRNAPFLERGYAVLTLADIAVNAQTPTDTLNLFLMDCLKREKSQWVNICYYESLYKLGAHEYYPYIIEQLDNRYYRNRCAAVHVLSSLVDSSTKKVTITALNNRLKTENAYSVISSMKSLLNRMNQID